MQTNPAVEQWHRQRRFRLEWSTGVDSVEKTVDQTNRAMRLW